MSQGLFQFPEQAAFNRVLPKSKIYEHAKPSRALRERFVSQVDRIVWQYKLSPETTNLPARSGVPEIQVFGLSLKTDEINEDVLRCIDKAIPFPIFYQISFGEKVKSTAAYKRPSDADPAKWLVDAYFHTSWQPAATAERSPLPLALDLRGLYEQMLRQHMPLPPRTGESLKAQVERIGEIRSLEYERRKMEAKLNKEIQFNRKVALNSQLRSLQTELEALSC